MAEQVETSNTGANATVQSATIPPAPKPSGFFSFKWAADTFNVIKNVVSGAIDETDSFLISNPVVKNTLNGVLGAGGYAGLGYALSLLVPGTGAAFTIAGLVAAVGHGVQTYATHQLDTAHINNVMKLGQASNYNQAVSQGLTNTLLTIIKSNPQIAAGLAAAQAPPAAKVVTPPTAQAEAPVVPPMPETPAVAPVQAEQKTDGGKA